MKIAEAIGAAFGTFSRIPVPKSAWTDFGSTHALAAFPLVGLAEGFLMTAWGHVANLLGVPATIVAAVLVALPVAVTGGIHLDGLCDTSDALASWAPREQKLEIMHDPRAGARGHWCCRVPYSAVFPVHRAAAYGGGVPRASVLARVLPRAFGARRRMLACRAGGRHGRWALACEEARGDRRAALRFRCGFGFRDGRVRSGRRRPYGGGGAFGARVVPPCCPVPLRRGDG